MRFPSVCALLVGSFANGVEASVVQIYAAGSTGQETMELRIRGETVRTFRRVRAGGLQKYQFSTPEKIYISTIRVCFTNDGVYNKRSMNLRVARINLDGTDYHSTDPTTFSTGAIGPTGECSPGYHQTRTLVCNGFFQYRRGNPNPPSPAPSPSTESPWELTFSENFNDNQVDEAKWNFGPNWGRINEEEQGYAPEAIRISNGKLRIFAERIPTEYDGQTMEFRSGLITTKDKFEQTYGKFEIRCKLPRGNGYWPAFWIIEDRKTGYQKEVDIMETVGNLPTLASFNFHHLDRDGKHTSYYSQWWGPDFTAGFHTYTLEWSRNRLVWFVDGVERNRIENSYVPRRDMYMIVNLAVGGGFPNATNTPPDETTPQKASLVVDYVRAYQRREE